MRGWAIVWGNVGNRSASQLAQRRIAGTMRLNRGENRRKCMQRLDFMTV